LALRDSKRILAIDFGDRRLGIAVSDPTNLIAQGVTTLLNDSTLFDRLRALVSEYRVGTILVGIPYTLKGEVGQKAREINRFVSELRREVVVSVVTWDERFTTKLAHEAMIQMGIKKKNRRRKENVDRLASVLLLQSYLDSLKT
jgi:putative Holliday junction resolvase